VDGRDLAAAFVDAGRTLLSLGLVRGSEGNLSTWDGERLRITRTGCELSSLGHEDVVEGTLEAPPADASSDLALHLAQYREAGPGAVVHAHPRGSVPQGWIPGADHGAYAFGATLEEALVRLVREVREGEP
jgi:ribulose-5-phosphate 4-epimerase/fuculose-1-phosphate aldolase